MAFINIIQAFSNSGGTPQYALVDGSRRVVITGDASAVAVPVSGPLTDTQLRATPVPISGTVTANQGGAWTVSVSGSVAVTGPLTDTQLRATPVPISGTVTANQGGAWTVSVSGSVAVTGPLTDTQLRATPVPISGTVTANQGGSWTVTANAGTGTFTVADNQTLTDNLGFTDGTSKLFMGGFIFDEVAGTVLSENDAAAARIDLKRSQIISLEDATTRGTRAVVRQPNADALTAANLQGLAVISANYVFNGATYDAQRGNAAGGTFVQGPAANDAAAAGNPVQVGGVYRATPNTVEDGDIGSLNIDDQQNLLTGTRRTTLILTAINTTYNNVTTTATSASLDCFKFRRGFFGHHTTKANTPTDITYVLQYSADDSIYFDFPEDPWTDYSMDDASIGVYGTWAECLRFDIPARYIRVKATATGTDATNTITCANAILGVID